MATTAVEAPQAPVNTGPSKKKTRMNPARRKSAKAKGDVEKAAIVEPKATETIPPTTTIQVPNVVPKTAGQPNNTIPPSQTPVKKGNVHAPPTQTIGSKPVSTTPTTKQPSKQIVVPRKTNPTQAKHSTNTSNTKPSTLAATAPALITGGLLGCIGSASILLGISLWHNAAGSDAALLAAKSAQLCTTNLLSEITTSLKAGTFYPTEALDMLRRTTLAYASSIPNGAPTVERVFREIDQVRLQRGGEVDKVVKETYLELERAGREGKKPDEMREVVVKHLGKLAVLTSSATQDVVARNPGLGPFQQATVKSLQPPPQRKVPTVRVNMAVRAKPAILG